MQNPVYLSVFPHFGISVLEAMAAVFYSLAKTHFANPKADKYRQSMHEAPQFLLDFMYCFSLFYTPP